MLNITHALKARMSAGEKAHIVLVGPGNDPHPTVKALSEMGFDAVMVDREHSLVNPETVYAYVRAGKSLGVPVLVRPEESYANWRCLLDSGVAGLMLSMTDTVDEVARAVDRAYYPPLGHRGYGLGMVPAQLDGMDPNTVSHLEMLRYLNDNVILLPQMESLRGIANLRRILALEGVDGTVVGTFDLALDIGGVPEGASRLDMTRAPAVEAALAEVGRICVELGKPAGIGGVPPEDMALLVDAGYRLFIYGTVVDDRLEAVRDTLLRTKQLMGDLGAP